MKVPVKPGFVSGDGWVDSGYLPLKVRLELQDHIAAANLPKAQVEKFLDSCNRFAQMICAEREQIGPDIERDELEAIATTARRLLAAIKATQQQTRITLEVLSEEVTMISNPPIDLPETVIADMNQSSSSDGLLSRSWDYVQALGQVADHAATQVKPTRQAKPELINGRHLTAHVVEAYWRRFNALPPAGRSGWFVGFMACLGAHMNMQCGPRIVSGVISAMKSATR